MKESSITPLTARDEKIIFEDLRKICCSPGYIHTIAYLCWRDNIIRFSDEKLTNDDYAYQYSGEQLIRTEISTLVGLMVQCNIELNLPEPKVLQQYINETEHLLHEMHMCLQKPWAIAFQNLDISSGRKIQDSPFNTASGLREPIFYAAESAYNFQYDSMARLKYRSDDAWLKSKFGFSIDEACDFALSLNKFQLQKLKDTCDGLIALPKEQWTLLPGFMFSLSEMLSLSKICQTTMESIVKAFTFCRLNRNKSFSDLSSFNETKSSPIIQIDDDKYVLLQGHSLSEAIYEAPFFWMCSDKSYYPSASRNRGQFTEHFLANCLSNVFGEQFVHSNVDIYKGKKRIAEADVLIIYGDQAIVVQAKSKRLTVEARKGNDLQLKSDFRKAISGAYDQALLCCRALADEGYRFLLPTGVELKLAQKPERVFIICAVSDHYPALATQVKQFLNIKATKHIMSPMITDVFFVDVLTELLSSPLQLLNYLALRAKYDDQVHVSQEFAVLGYHLSHNLWLEEKYNFVNIGDDFCVCVDIAMAARRIGVPGEKIPKGILTRFIGTPIGWLLSEIERIATPELVGLGMMLLQMSSDAAKHINNGIKKIVTLSGEDNQQHDMSVPSELDRFGFTIHANSLDYGVAKDRLFMHCQVRKYDTKSNKWFGILLEAGTGRIKSALVISEKWKTDPKMDQVLAIWPKKPMVPIRTLSANIARRKIGRNDPCPCGSGAKYKKCCMSK